MARNMTADGRPTHHANQPVGHLIELANIERLLRLDDRAIEPHVDVGNNGARISWNSLRHNSHARGSLTESVANEIASTEAWGLSTVHDPLQRDGEVTSMLAVLYIPDEDSESETSVEADHGDGFGDTEYVDADHAEACINALAVDFECDNLAAAQLDARDLLVAITSGDSL